MRRKSIKSNVASKDQSLEGQSDQFVTRVPTIKMDLSALNENDRNRMLAIMEERQV